MGQIVKCDVCGKIYNESHLTSHKRRSHGKREASPCSSSDGPASLEMIVSLFAQLPDDRKREVLNRLAAATPKP